jgi:Spy/CpxP family protein refolding chaperone
MRRWLLPVGLAMLLAGVAAAEQATHGGHALHGGAAAGQPYAGQEQRRVSSLSDEEVRDHLAGRGMGYAKPAELHGYPGPMHVLELADRLGLSAQQRARIEAIFAGMQARATAAGARYVAAERAIDEAFRSGAIDRALLEKLVREAGERRAEERLVHLEAHLEAAPVLSAEQRSRYAELRGYGGAAHRRHGQ